MLPNTPTRTSTAAEPGLLHRDIGSLAFLRGLGSALNALIDPLGKQLCLATFRASDDAFWRRQARQRDWRRLGGIVEYTPELLAVTTRDGSTAYVAAFRAPARVMLKRVVIRVKTKKGDTIHQQSITLKGLGRNPVCMALTAIPAPSKPREDSGWHRLGDVYIKLVEAVHDNGTDLVGGNKIAEIFAASCGRTDAHGLTERWGRYWNIDAIRREKEDLSAAYYRDLVLEPRRDKRPLKLRRLAYRLVSSSTGLSLAFWSRNLGHAAGLRASLARAASGA
ncbi:MAG: hypothetical protein QNJ91_11510 [Gammaproteobacteria bacterium]|nr:hypothetical protein [Gammaproteobacteria bacterium]